MLTTFQVFCRLFVAAIAGGIIGIERERSHQSAGFRTHILITVGVALVMIISTTKYAPGAVNNDPMRLASQAISGIGFLGAGTILKEGANIRGLTTATGLWVAAALGLAFGAGMYREGAMVLVITLLTLTMLSRWERGVFREKFGSGSLKSTDGGLGDEVLELEITRDFTAGIADDIGDILRGHRMRILQISLDPKRAEDLEDGGVVYFTAVSAEEGLIGAFDDCLEQIRKLRGIKRVEMRVLEGRD